MWHYEIHYKAISQNTEGRAEHTTHIHTHTHIYIYI